LRASHEGLRPFSCSVEGCNKDFKHKYQLEKHIKSHDEIPKITCPNKKRKVTEENEINNILGVHSTVNNTLLPVPGYYK